ncbi:hypothetical protein MK805_15985 [Shimazuella sp. AN120528]|uniref:hypothetical protein n=1 Tax=Shimazuella soli TaxID=1892854 RepID=UPI001F115130|nr:hypothetical protein [Shimazuella soli]MCH5586442.1 hypothetical protein [Shimazuella soli]
MDPNKSLEGFRVDALKPKKEAIPSPKQTYKKGNAILIILFASLIGLTTGIGSAFAFGIKEMPPSSSPLDEPSAQSHVDQVEPSIKQSEIKTSDLSPQKPPIDEPTVKVTSPNDEPIKKDTPITKHKEEKSKDSEKSNHEKHPNEHKSEPTESKSTSEQKTLPASNQNTAMTSSKSDNYTSNSTASSAGEHKVTASAGNIQTDKQEVQNKSVSGAVDTKTQTNQKSNSSDKVAVSSEETPDPKTKSGTLPETAGNDLNHAVASFVIVCFSIAYLLARKETHPEN